jgi:hypothetical protein
MMSNKFRRIRKDKYAAFKTSLHPLEQDDLHLLRANAAVLGISLIHEILDISNTKAYFN